MALSSCSPKMITKLTSTLPPLNYKEEVAVLYLDQEIPSDAIELGELIFGDKGQQLNCNYESIIEQAKVEVRKAGGNLLKITRHEAPKVPGTSCHRITAKIFKMEDISSVETEDTSDVIPDADYALLNVYRYSGAGALVGYNIHLGDSIICRAKNRSKYSIKIYKEGHNSLWAKTESKSEIPINIKMGEVYYVRCTMKMGVFIGRPHLEMIDDKSGKVEFESLEVNR